MSGYESAWAAAHEWFELRKLLNHWDPIGVYDPQTNFPADEYDCLEAPLMSRLRAGETPETIESFLGVELRDHFGIDPGPTRVHDFVRELLRWFEP